MSGRAALPPVEPRFTRAALRFLMRRHGPDGARRMLGVPRSKLAQMLAGELPLKQDSQAAIDIVSEIVDYLDGAHNRARADAIRKTLPLVFGERAMSRVQGRREVREHERARAAASSVPQRRMFGAGIHVAPFLSREGEIVLVATDILGCRAFMAECGTPRGGLFNNGVAADEFTATDEIELADSGESIMGALRGDKDFTTKVEGRRVYTYGPPMFGYGVHTCPWRPWNKHQGFTLAAVDHQHRLVALMDASDPESAREARRELTVILEMLAPEPYRDGYGQRVDDSADDFGDEWKRGGGA